MPEGIDLIALEELSDERPIRQPIAVIENIDRLATHDIHAVQKIERRMLTEHLEKTL
jgi:hypothetical protein